MSAANGTFIGIALCTTHSSIGDDENTKVGKSVHVISKLSHITTTN
jgi:hypothetical protein